MNEILDGDRFRIVNADVVFRYEIDGDHRPKNDHPAHVFTVGDRRKAAAATNEIRREKRYIVERLRLNRELEQMFARDAARRQRKAAKQRRRREEQKAKLGAMACTPTRPSEPDDLVDTPARHQAHASRKRDRKRANLADRHHGSSAISIGAWSGCARDSGTQSSLAPLSACAQGPRRHGRIPPAGDIRDWEGLDDDHRAL